MCPIEALTTPADSSATPLDALLRPRHVAVIGASASVGKLGHTVLRNLVRGGFAGPIYAVNPKGEDVEGQPGYRSVGDIPGGVDCAFIAIPAAGITDAVRACAAAGVRAVIVGAAGFAELGDDTGRRRQAELSAIAAAAGMRLLGPNTNGVLDTGHQLYLGYNSSHAERFASGPVSIISHSGALFDGVARRLRAAGAGLASFIPVGNEADITLLEVFEALIADARTRVIGLVIEGISDGDAFVQCCLAAHAAGKHVVALKIGRSTRGAGATLAHSSRLAGSARACDALFEAAGVASVPTVEALAGACALLARLERRQPLPDQRLVCVTTSGAGGAILADFATLAGFELAGNADGSWPAAAQGVIDTLPTAAPIRNPIDTGSLGDWALLEPAFAAIEASGFCGPTVVYAHIAATAVMAADLARALCARRARIAAPLAILSPGGLGDAAEAAFVEHGIPVFHDTAACFESLKACRPRPPQWQAPAAPAAVQGEIATLLARAGTQVMNELDSARVLALAGLPMVRSVVVTDSEAALAGAHQLGYPLVLKALAPGVAHKNQLGFVLTRIADEASLVREFAAMQARVVAAGYPLEQTPLLLQPMQAAELELILGVSHEPGLGHFLVCGLGGIHTELFDELELLHIATPAAALRARLTGSRIGGLLASIDRTGGSGQQSLIDQVCAALGALQALVQQHAAAIDSIDVNPLLISKISCLAVDALILPKKHA